MTHPLPHGVTSAATRVQTRWHSTDPGIRAVVVAMAMVAAMAVITIEVAQLLTHTWRDTLAPQLWDAMHGDREAFIALSTLVFVVAVVLVAIWLGLRLITQVLESIYPRADRNDHGAGQL